VATPAGDLAARWVIHTVGPVYSPHEDRSELLRSCYRSSLQVADTLDVRSVAFPLISAGAFGWPLDDALRQAIGELRAAGYPGVAQLVLWQDETLARARSILHRT
jgi:O-acetyl-ADP-ribose deacetylase (regulator of RNase III)